MKKLIAILGLSLLAQPTFAAQQCDAKLERTAPNTRFATQTNGTVKDLQTGLTWMRCALGMSWNNQTQSCDGDAQGYTWQSALKTAQTINNVSGGHKLHNFAGIAKWRLPNIKELVALTERACHSPALNGRAFASAYGDKQTGDLDAYIWSSTPAGDGGQVLNYDSFNGEMYPRDASDSDYSVLLVADQ